MLPSITIIGNTTSEAELRFTQSGKPVANLTVVANKSRKTETGEWEDVARSPFIRVSVWDAAAEAVAEAVDRPGTKVIVTGQLLAREYEDRDGNKRESIELDYATVGIIPQARRADRQQPAQPAQQQPWGQPQQQQADPWATPQQPNQPPF